MDAYLNACDNIDWQNPQILTCADDITTGKTGDADIARACFEFVRDNIKHSWDYQQNPVTLRASEVLQHGSSFCYGKSHLLAALLRAKGIPAALCYQRLTLGESYTSDGFSGSFCLHGLNAIYLREYGWYRVDARGNNAQVDAQFQPPQEKLAFATTQPGERDLAERFSEPLPVVIAAHAQHEDIQSLALHLPDLA